MTKARVSLDVQRRSVPWARRLFTRTARRVRLTDAGRQLLAGTAPLVACFAALHPALRITLQASHRVSSMLAGGHRRVVPHGLAA